MSWPLAFVAVGAFAAMAFMVWCVSRTPQSETPTTWWATTDRPTPLPTTPCDGTNDAGEPTWSGYTLADIAADPNGYIAQVRKETPKHGRP